MKIKQCETIKEKKQQQHQQKLSIVSILTHKRLLEPGLHIDRYSQTVDSRFLEPRRETKIENEMQGGAKVNAVRLRTIYMRPNQQK